MRVLMGRGKSAGVFLGLIVLGAITAGCGLFEELPPAPTATPVAQNVLVNGGFEEGAAPWWTPNAPDWRGFGVSESVSRSGDASMVLELRGERADEGTRIAGAVQSLFTGEFPEFLSGFYRVEEWEPSATFQYLQFVVSVRGGDFPDPEVHEIRFIIAGAEEDPVPLPAARFLYLNRDAPKKGEWTYFGYPIREAFETRIGWVPASWEAIDVSVEARYDGKTAEQPASGGIVYFDDLYIGPQVYNPNPPSDR